MSVALSGNVKLAFLLAAGVLLGLLTIALLAAHGGAVSVGSAKAQSTSLLRPLGVLWH